LAGGGRAREVIHDPIVCGRLETRQSALLPQQRTRPSHRNFMSKLYLVQQWQSLVVTLREKRFSASREA
jgi:hypothetical protein